MWKIGFLFIVVSGALTCALTLSGCGASVSVYPLSESHQETHYKASGLRCLISDCEAKS